MRTTTHAVVLALLTGPLAFSAGGAAEGRGAAQAETATAQLFSAGGVSSADPEFGLAFSPGGRQVFFNRAPADRTRFELRSARLEAGRWVVADGPVIPGPYLYFDPFVTADGRHLYVSSNRPGVDGAPARADFDLWVAERRADGWTTLARVPGVNTDRAEIFCSLTAAGDLYFASDRDGAMAVYAAARTGDGTFGPPVRLTFGARTDVGATNPLVSADGRFLVFAASGPDASGSSDLYVAEREGTGWSAPRNLGPRVNSPFADFAPAWGPGERELYFTSERPGVAPARADGGRPPGDLYVVPRGVLARR